MAYPRVFKTPALHWSRHRDVNPVPTSHLADGLITAPSGPVLLTLVHDCKPINLFNIQLYVLCGDMCIVRNDGAR